MALGGTDHAVPPIRGALPRLRGRRGRHPWSAASLARPMASKGDRSTRLISISALSSDLRLLTLEYVVY
jgi:hypothetical protein